jgi:hypothetical protein
MKLEDLETKLGISGLSEEGKLALVKDIQANLPSLKAEQMKLESQTQAQMVIAAVKKIQENVENRFNELSGFIENKAAKITSGKDGIQGPKGEKGDKGDRGADGYQGRDGKDGKDGEKGDQGVGVADARVDFDGSLVITLTDGTEIDAGEVLPLDTTEKLKVYFNNPAPTGGGGAVDSVNGQTGEVVLTASDVGAATTAQGTKADTAYGWGNHASAGYLTTFTEVDPVFVAHAAYNVTNTKISNWDSAYSWGNHASAGYAVLTTAQSFTAAQRGAVSALTDGATITPNFAAANNFSVTLGGSRTLANPTNLTAGQSGIIKITQDATGSRTLAFGSYWKFSNGTAPTLTTTANAVDVLAYYVDSSTTITAKLITDRK